MFKDIARDAAVLDATLKSTTDTADRANRALGGMVLGATAASHALREVKDAANDTVRALRDIPGAASAGAGVTAYWGGRWFGLFGLIARAARATVPLFAIPALGIQGWHVMADSILEVVTVFAAATVAAVAFGVAASDAVNEVVGHLQSAHIAADAFGGSVYPLTGKLEKMHDAVRPAVYQLFGDALLVAAARADTFAGIATGAAGVLEKLGARVAVAMSQPAGVVHDFLATAVPDLAKLGDILLNLGTVFGQVFKALPGYASMLLGFVDQFTKVLAVAAQAVEPLLRVGLALHGIFVWAGLAVTIAYKLGTVLFAAGASVVMFARDMYGLIAALIAFGRAQGLVALLELMTPAGWFALAAGVAVGLGALVVWLMSARDATQKWVAQLQKTIDVAPIVDASARITGAMIQTTTRLNIAYAQLAHTQRTQVSTGTEARFGLIQQTSAYADQQKKISELQQAHSQFQDQLSIERFRMGELSRQYGGAANAEALLNKAGITTKDILHAHGEEWKVVRMQVAAAAAGYRAMGVSLSQAGANQEALDRLNTKTALGTRIAAVKQLNQAWDDLIATTTGGQTTFDTFELNLRTVAQNFEVAVKNARPLTHTIDGLRATSTTAGAAVDSLSQAGLQLNQAFSDSVSSAQQMIDNWRTAGMANDLFTQGVKLTIGQMVRYARGSGEATAQLVALAQQAGYHGPAAMKTLVAWLGNTHNATRRLKDIADQATIQEGLLTSAMNSQGDYISQTLIGDINGAILQYDGVRDAARRYGDAIARSGAQSDAAHKARQTLINDLVSSGQAAGDTTGQIASLISKILHIPLRRAISIVEQAEGLGHYSIREQSQALGSGGHPHAGAGARGLIPGGFQFAEGGRIPGYGGGDIVPILAEPGETVVSKEHSRALATAFRAAGVPGYQAGGTVTRPFSKAHAISGEGFTNFDRTFVRQFTNAVEGTMLTDMRAAIRRALSGQAAIVRDAMSWIGKIPYVWGGTAVPGGADCSGFTSTIYARHNIAAPRTSEAQGSWVRRGPPVPGGLAFYNSPAGGPPPGHVAIIGFNNMVISQGGGMGPQFTGLHGPGPLMFTGTPPGGFPGGFTGFGGGGNSLGGMSGGDIARLWVREGGPAYAAGNMARIAWVESRDIPSAVQTGQPPGLTGYGLYQITPTSGIWQNGMFGNLLNAANNTRAAIYLFNRSGYAPWGSDPVGASLGGSGGGARGRPSGMSGTTARFAALGGAIDEPVLGIGRSGTHYLFGEAGREHVVPGPAGGEDAVSVLQRIAADIRTIRDIDANLAGDLAGAVGDSLNGVARSAGASYFYSNR